MGSEPEAQNIANIFLRLPQTLYRQAHTDSVLPLTDMRRNLQNVARAERNYWALKDAQHDQDTLD